MSREEMLKADFIVADDIKVSNIMIDGIMSTTRFVENMKALHIDFEQDLKSEVSALRQEVAELKQKLEEK